jgi:hypothetical protein
MGSLFSSDIVYVHLWSWETYHEDVREEAHNSFPTEFDRIMFTHERFVAQFMREIPFFDTDCNPMNMLEACNQQADNEKALEWLEVQTTILKRWENEAAQEKKQGHWVRYNCPKKTPCICPGHVGKK